VCDPCVAIANGSSMDVIEMDAASNRSVDDIRDLRERVGYAPPEGTWKVYILDEAHMLTREAWNAFLKTLEEPPPHTVFVLATTEAHKVMPTIVDRCQRFDFGRPSPDEIAIVLRRAADAEAIEVDAGAVGAIARAANGSFRDALGTLDQLVAYSGAEIATDDVLAVLGVADAELIFRATEAIAAGDGAEALRVSAAIAAAGHDPSRFATDLIAHLRQLLVIATLDEIPEHFLVVPGQEARLAEQARRLGGSALLRAIDELAAAQAGIREGDEARLTVELALLRSARPEIDPTRAALTQRLERLEQALARGTPAVEPAAPEAVAATEPLAPGVTAAEGPDGGPDPPGPAAAASTAPPAAEAAQPAPQPQPEPPATPAPGPVAVAVPELDRVIELWPGVLDQMRQEGAGLLSAVVGVARPVAVDPEARTLTIGFPPDSAFHLRKAEDKESRELVAAAIQAVLGAPLRPVYTKLEEGESETPAAGDAGAGGGDDLFDRIVTEFDAEVVTDEQPEQPDERIEETS
ncbi:MAG TPA: DNA polymerase III subunit gamma/tau, partial [Solirubrobacterales bacterium]|nr:DNA polymerase III subunit gamma/tau [Solirubrobacterales bacterium]